MLARNDAFGKDGDTMFHWLSDYNYDFALAAIPIQIMIMWFYLARRNLSLRSSKSFLYVMMTNLCMTMFDIISCEMNEIWTQYPLWLMYLVNHGYFVAFILRGWSLFDYTAEECNAYQKMGRYSKCITWIPACFVTCLILSTPWTSAIFHFDQGIGYHNCALYPLIYYSTYFYIAASLYSVFITWKQIERHLKLSMLCYNGVLIAGIFLRKLFINTLVTSYFSIMAILAIYLAAQNPDLYRDRKTGLFNRDALDRIASEFLRNHKSFTIVVATIHNYESAKALYGSQQMNRSLGLIGRWIQQNFPKDYVFYFGNGDYLLLDDSKTKEEREQVVKRIHERFSKPWQAEDTDVALSVASLLLPGDILPDDPVALDGLIDYAYVMAHAENENGNIVMTPDAMSQLTRRKEVEQALALALKEHRIEAYFQPIYSTKEHRIVGAEALARLNDPKLGFIPPDEFIRVAEQNGDIMEVGRQMFENVCEFLSDGRVVEAGVRRINVNLSPAQCMSDLLASELSDIAMKFKVDMKLIDFEITESSMVDISILLKQMLVLKDKGAAFSLDDFGTGTSNVTRLMNLPINTVKLDLYVVHSYFNGESLVLPDLVRMFQNAKKEVVVEGIETLEMVEKMTKLQCDYLQGYYFSKPVPAKDFMQYLSISNQGELNG